MHGKEAVNRRRSIAVVWIGLLLSGLPTVGQEPSLPPDFLELPVAEQRRHIHAELPADANLEDLLHAHAEFQIDPGDESLDASCPCRGAFVDEDSSEHPRSGRTSRPAPIFGSAALVFAAMFTGWQVYRGRR